MQVRKALFAKHTSTSISTGCGHVLQMLWWTAFEFSQKVHLQGSHVPPKFPFACNEALDLGANPCIQHRSAVILGIFCS